MVQLVGGVEHVIERHVLLDGGIVHRRVTASQCIVLVGQHDISFGIDGFSDGAFVHRDVGLGHEVLLLGLGELHVVPVADGVVQPVGDVVGHEGRRSAVSPHLALLLRVGIIGVEVGPYVYQFQATVGTGGNVECHVLVSAVGLRRAGVGRYGVVVDVCLAVNVPVVSWRGIGALILASLGVAVVENGVGGVYEVARRLEGLQIVRVVLVHALRLGVGVVGRDEVDGSSRRAGLAVLVAGIYVAAANARHHVDQVQLDDAGDVSPVFGLRLLAVTLLGEQLQRYARSQCYLVGALAVVAQPVCWVGTLVLVVSGGVVACHACSSAYGLHAHVAGQSAQIVYRAVYTEVVAVAAANAVHDVERHFAHAVDGIEIGGLLLGHTVAGALHHHAAAPDAGEVGALEGVHGASGVAAAHTGLNPVGLVFGAHLVVVLVNHHVAQAVPVVRVDALVLQLVVGLFALLQLHIGVVVDVRAQRVEVGAVVAHAELAVAPDQCQVAVAVEAAVAVGAYRDEVAAVDVVDGGADVGKHGGRVGRHDVVACRHIATGKNGVADGDARQVEVGPLFAVAILVLQGVQIVGGHEVALAVGMAVYGDAARDGHFAVRLDDDGTVCRQVAAVVPVAVGSLRAAAVDIAHVAAAENVAVAARHTAVAAHDVAVAAGDARCGAYLAAAHQHLGGAEYAALGLCRLAHLFAQLVVAVAATSAEDVALHLAFQHLHMRAAGDADRKRAVVTDRALTHLSQLAAAVDAALHGAAFQQDVGGADGVGVGA